MKFVDQLSARPSEPAADAAWNSIEINECGRTELRCYAILASGGMTSPMTTQVTYFEEKLQNGFNRFSTSDSPGPIQH